ncbi:MAG TPA: glycoside hydrolase family 76 protein [Ktedonobacteraceae bacterium]|nr:glycoside hydrolase family 76 protein [Ktedonobacteraceae bacterium]
MWKLCSSSRIVGGTRALAFFGLLLLICQLGTDYVREVRSYQLYADASMMVLQRMYDAYTGQWSDASWWQQANVLETVIDYSSRTNTTTYTGDIATTFNANKSTSFLNDYYDDEGWWALAWMKAYDLTNTSSYLGMAKAIFNNMTRGWDSKCGGGIWWDKDKTYKNAIANELFLEVAARLHQRTPGDTVGGGSGPRHTSYIDWANKEWQWFKNSGMLNASNLVNDGLDSGTCVNNGRNPWTYNQGVILGALTDLYKITGDASYLAQAEAIADANNRTNIDDNGILYEKGCEPSNSCGTDGPQFKGIFMKNLYYLYQSDNKQAYKNFIIKNVDAIWNRGRDRSNHLGLHWDGPFDRAQARNQSSATDAVNAAIALSSPITDEVE